ncbi:hypothetical protein [Lewinella sp. IMCC34191]|uniref:hypothetical protein n=1 Tax=Lewinella sp. IMCC34191 TaxID=2259172 RepID=UPI00130037A4|nr:hypothetical protein [Lewinella sp. IMCC34191]
MSVYPCLLATLFLSLVLFSCGDDDDGSVGDPVLQLLPHTGVRFVEVDSLTRTFERVASGDSLLLEARLYRDPIPEAIDDEHELVLTIPLAADALSFSYVGASIPMSSAFLSAENCFCFGQRAAPITNGEISGQRERADVWRVRGYVTTETGFHFEVGGRYTVR